MPKFSTSFQATPRSAILRDKLFHKDTPILQANAIRANHSIGKQFVGISEGKLTAFTLPILYQTDVGANVVLAGRGDEIGPILPVMFTDNLLRGWVASFVPVGAVNYFSLPASPDDPTMVPAPGLEEDEEPQVPNMARLHYKFAEKVEANLAFAPKIALVPTLYMVIPGEEIPFDHFLLDDLPGDVDLHNSFHTWFYAHQHNQRMSAGISQHHDDVVLDWEVLRTPEFNDRTLSDSSEAVLLGMDTTSEAFIFWQDIYLNTVADIQSNQPIHNNLAPGGQPNLLDPGTLTQVAGIVAAFRDTTTANSSKTDRNHVAEVTEATQH